MAMHLASMVHGSGREREAHDRHYHQQQPLQQSHYYSQQHQQPQSYAAAPAQYSTHISQQQVEYQYQRHPQSPPSPPVEEQKPSLPSISSLLHIADGEKAASETAGQSPSPRSQPHSPQPGQEHQSSVAVTKQQPESRSEQAFGPTIVSHPRLTLPPTPPMHPDSVVDGNQSPSTASTHSGAGSYYLGQSLNNMEPHQQRQTGPHSSVVRRTPLPQSSMSPYSASSYAPSPYASSPGPASAASFYSPESHPYSMGMYGQRALPSNFQPQMPLPLPTPSGNGSNPWQHHHYISTSSQSAFPQSQDRYICSTCNKAFSRPSSLRIHSHSHTGEKPYKCPQPGCGKAFSVRSNMKRHERGCHASTTLTT
ncbi:hypothetical protein DPSP01_009697 [Paraphaeosphaeria sporulosa]|uniref:C2H2-type domain-containing protein n=1 Tax=Paraphaeosphaeria sporulosa TaxID=1460663 RepID=A0A177CDT9_9PLEO|nr:uncharacterized protein CC84DRAFT_809496 [Paraphaeosphaeria sporulosa]OAG04927.1 hypothetical protein CC84DRAFT_809496 [Paraphaeosphaeria sporulosa]